MQIFRTPYERKMGSNFRATLNCKIGKGNREKGGRGETGACYSDL